MITQVKILKVDASLFCFKFIQRAILVLRKFHRNDTNTDKKYGKKQDGHNVIIFVSCGEEWTQIGRQKHVALTRCLKIDPLIIS